MKCVAVTPEKTVIDKDVKFVAVPLADGEYGVDRNHAPVVGRLGAGEMRLTLVDGSVERWFVEGGFVEVLDNVVSLLANYAAPYEELKLDDAMSELQAALESDPGASFESKERLVAVARAKARAAEKARELKR